MTESGHTYLERNEISGDVLPLNIEDESAAILEAAKAAGVGHTAKTLVKDGPLRVVIIGMKPGASLHEHQSPGPVTVHVLAGQVDVASAGRSDSLQAGRALVFGPAVAHSLQAATDSVVLLTIAWPSS
jgi:quercetin dioxygenase-like cupin family protein